MQQEIDMQNSFPEENLLYFEMVALLAPLYFPPKHDDDSIHELTLGEFFRVREILCKKYSFNEDKHILENGESPFDSVRDDVEREVYARIREDKHLITLTGIREELITLIRSAVEKSGNCIGTFYTNIGIPYNETPMDVEHGCTPIVVTKGTTLCNSYESASLFDLFIKNGQLLCTLNGESGEDFDVGIETIQTDNLVDIVLWLKEHSFLPSDAKQSIPLPIPTRRLITYPDSSLGTPEFYE